jgi:hypothetical protein
MILIDYGYNMISCVIIAILFNMFFHKFTDFYYKDLIFEERYKKSIVMLFIVGILGVVIGKLYMIDKFNKNLSYGVMIGGVLVVLSAMGNNWQYMDETGKLCTIGILLAASMYYFNNKKNKSIKNKKERLLKHGSKRLINNNFRKVIV